VCMLLSVCPGSEWVDPYDPTVVAESELLSAANSIEAAARKLSQLQPRELVSKVCTVWHNALFIARGGGLLAVLVYHVCFGRESLSLLLSH